MNEQELFCAALEQEPNNRAAFLDSACGTDEDLRRRLDNLLKCHAHNAAYFQKPAAEILATEPSPVAGTLRVPPPSDAETCGTVIGPYKLLEQIGEGGMGLVYMAEQQQPVRRLVALKIIKPGMDTRQVIARFEAERQALAMMDHPNIAKILDAGTVGGPEVRDQKSEIRNDQPATPLTSDLRPLISRPYFVMELVRGLPITDFCDQKRLAVRERLQLFIQVCQAVQHAHQKGIIHRDLKPTNVLVTMADTVPFPKIIDFGIAKALGGTLTRSVSEGNTVHTGFAQMLGTPLYMSPEQAEMNLFGVDTRSDVYSLGVLLYELLTGTTPFDKDRLKSATFDEMRRIIREEEPETVSARIAKTRRVGPARAASAGPPNGERATESRWAGAALVPPYELDWIVMRSLEKDRSRRYESASALAADIQSYLSDEPVLACPPTTMYRFQKFARKHKASLSTAATVALCLLLGTTVSAWQAVRATTAEAEANANEQKANANAAAAEQKEQEAIKQRDEVKALADQLRRTLYASNMNLAQHAWDTGNITRVNDLLDQHRPKPGDADLRGFEWHYLYRLCHADLLTLKGYSVALSPDGKRLASFDGNIVKVRDAETGRELLVCKGHTDGVESLTFSPDGKRIASCGGNFWDRTKNAYPAGKPNGELKVWDAQTGQELLDCKGHTDWIMSVVFSPDGQRLATASLDKTVKVWNADTGLELLTLEGHSNIVRSVAFSTDSKRIASVGADSNVRVWDAQSGQELLTFKGGGGVAFSPDGKRLASGGGGLVTVRNAESGQELLTFKGGGKVIAYSPDGQRLAGGSGDNTVNVWDAETGQELFTYRGHSGSVRSVVFNFDGTRLASSSSDDTVKVWDASASPESRSLRQFADNVDSLAFSPDGKRLATGSDTWITPKKGTVPVEIKVWDTRTGNELLVLSGATRIPVFSPDGKRLAGAGGGVRVWDAETGKDLLTLKGHDGIYSVAYSSDGRRLASAGHEGNVKMWDAENGEELNTFKGHTSIVWSVAFSPDGKRLASTSQDATVKVWDVQTGRELLSLKGSDGHASNVTYSPDGKRLASSLNVGRGEPGETKVWDAQTGEELLSLKGHTGSVGSVAYSPDGKRLVSGSGNTGQRGLGEVKIWDAQTGQELLTINGGAFNHRVAFSPDGHRLASNAGGTVKIYDATPLPEKP